MVSFNTPPLDSPVRELKFIGSLINSRFKELNIRTLRDMRDIFKDQTIAQNKRLLHKILENPRKLQCVGRIIENQQYCVRRYNQLAWQAIIKYLIKKGVPANKLPPQMNDRGRREICRNRCEVNDDRPERPYSVLEIVTIVMLNQDRPMSTNDVYEEIQRAISRKRISASIAANSDNRGRQIFEQVSRDPDTLKKIYNIKDRIRRRLSRLTIREIVQYLRQ